RRRARTSPARCARASAGGRGRPAHNAHGIGAPARRQSSAPPPAETATAARAPPSCETAIRSRPARRSFEVQEAGAAVARHGSYRELLVEDDALAVSARLALVLDR